MRKLLPALAGVLVFAAGIEVGRAWKATPADAADTTPEAQLNGDTNGDGRRDLSDAILLLRWLFASGPAPVPISRDCPPRFIDPGDGTVFDTMTGLEWSRKAVDVDGNGTVDAADMVSRIRADEIVSSLALAGRTGWRLPFIGEMYTIADPDGHPAGAFPPFDLLPEPHWLASTNGSDPCHGCTMDFTFQYGGYSNIRAPYDSELELSYVLVVRAP